MLGPHIAAGTENEPQAPDPMADEPESKLNCGPVQSAIDAGREGRGDESDDRAAAGGGRARREQEVGGH